MQNIDKTLSDGELRFTINYVHACYRKDIL